jgi:hypothetical protein
MNLTTRHAEDRAQQRYAIDVSRDDTAAEHVALILAGESKRLGKQPANGRWGPREVHAFVHRGKVYVCVWSVSGRRIVTYLPSRA